MKGLDAGVVLTPEQEAEARRLAELILTKAREEVLAMARIMVSKPDPGASGQSEFRCAIERTVFRPPSKPPSTSGKRGTKGRA
ncbi:MAG: hypothetical protein U0744_21355 [Gemmataceae bacterium]